MADRARSRAFDAETIVRIYSMTKPLVSVAIMMLYEEGRFQLDDSIARLLPCFGASRVMEGQGTVPAERAISFRDLLTHTAGLTYGFLESGPLDALYRAEGIDFQTADVSLGELVQRAAALPLLAQPGRSWNYSIATDVLGHLVELISGCSLGDFLGERILRPLGMTDTGFHVPAGKLDRFAANYSRRKASLVVIDDPAASRFADPGVLQSGGGGLCSTAADYLRFCRMMLNRGELDGVRLLGRKTVELMTSNHLRGDIHQAGPSRLSDSSFEGVGFGLGFSVMLDPARAQIVGSVGEYAWGGAASTAFWIDPAEQLIVILLCQLMPSAATQIRRELRVLSYASLVD